MKITLGNQRHGPGYYWHLESTHWHAMIYNWCDDSPEDDAVLWSVYDNTGNLKAGGGEARSIADAIKCIFDLVGHLEMREFYKRLYDMSAYRNRRPA